MERKLKFLHSKLGAVMKGYKTRRIYHNNKIIRKYRTEFREIIHFAYNLKKDIDQVQGKEKGEHIRDMLLTSLKDLVAKRQQFRGYFNKLLEGEEESHPFQSNGSFKGSFNYNKGTLGWLLDSQPKEI